MHGNAQLLVIGPAAVGSAVTRALPRCRSVTTDDLLGGIWTAGHTDFEGFVVSYSLGQRTLNAIRGLREVAPQARIVVTCSPADEPNARQALAAGADEYVLEPVTREDLETALQIVSAPPYVGGGGAGPSMEEVVRLSEVLKNLSGGLQPTLDRLAALLQRAFDAQGVAVRVDELSAVAGHPVRPVLQEAIRRQDAIVGGVSLGPHRRGTYTAGDAARLVDYARLIETIVGQVQEREHWQDLAWRDDLSGLRNRRFFDGTLEELVASATAQRLRLTVLLFDIDDFKTYNDRYGHDTGDALIREVAALLTRCSREHDVVARYGGDEFAVILWDSEKPRVPGSQHPTDPMSLADRLRHAIHGHDFKCLGPEAPGRVTISGGLACFPWDGKTRAEIVRAADDALLSAKRSGKNRIVLAEGVSSLRREDGRTEQRGDVRT